MLDDPIQIKANILVNSIYVLPYNQI